MRKNVTLFIICLVLLLIFYAYVTKPRLQVIHSLNPGLFIKFRSPDNYGNDFSDNAEATSIISYRIYLQAIIGSSSNMLKKTTIETNSVNPLGDWTLTWRNPNNPENNLSSLDIDKLRKVDQDLCFKIDKSLINTLDPLKIYKFGIQAVNNFGKYSDTIWTSISDTRFSALSCKDLESQDNCWADFGPYNIDTIEDDISRELMSNINELLPF
jgi:hypothetical protein